MPDLIYLCPNCEDVFESLDYEQDVSVNRTEYGYVVGVSESGEPYYDFHDSGDEYDWDPRETRLFCEGCSTELCYDNDIAEFLANHPPPEDEEYEEFDPQPFSGALAPDPKPRCMF